MLLATSSLTPAYEPVDEIDQLPCNLLFALPQAPAYVLSDGNGTANWLDGDSPDVKIVPELKFDAQTCPMCFFQGGIDDYSPNGSTQIYRQLRRMKIPAELHLYADRTHGFHGDMDKGDDGDGADHWFWRALEFIRQMNYDGTPLLTAIILSLTLTMEYRGNIEPPSTGGSATGPFSAHLGFQLLPSVTAAYTRRFSSQKRTPHFRI